MSCKWVKQQGPTKGFDYDVSKVEQIFDLLLKEKQLKLLEHHKFHTVQELQGRPYCKWHNSFTHATNDYKRTPPIDLVGYRAGLANPGEVHNESQHVSVPRPQHGRVYRSSLLVRHQHGRAYKAP